MFRRSFFPLLLAAPMAALFAAPVCTQAQSAHEANGAPNVELYGGYSYVFKTYNPTADTVSTSGMNGWDASLKIPLIGPFLGIKGDVSGFYRNDTPQLQPQSLLLPRRSAGRISHGPIHALRPRHGRQRPSHQLRSPQYQK